MPSKPKTTPKMAHALNVLKALPPEKRKQAIEIARKLLHKTKPPRQTDPT